MKRIAIVCSVGAAALAALLLWPADVHWINKDIVQDIAFAGEFPPLDAKQFVGEIRKAYEDAAKHPELFEQLHCYCGCDKADGHRNLLDCYRDYHGATCQICTEEALQATQMYDQGSPVEQIRDALRRRFAGEK